MGAAIGLVIVAVFARSSACGSAAAVTGSGAQGGVVEAAEGGSPIMNVLSNALMRLGLLREDLDRWRQWVPVPIRLIIGVGFLIHGWAKWSRGPAAFAELLRQVGVPLPLVDAWVVTLLEIFGGLAVLMGAFIITISVPLILSMLGAMLTVNIKYGFSAVNTIGLTSEGPQFGLLVTKSTCYTSLVWWR
jgi:putative oxidoreductase